MYEESQNIGEIITVFYPTKDTGATNYIALQSMEML